MFANGVCCYIITIGNTGCPERITMSENKKKERSGMFRKPVYHRAMFFMAVIATILSFTSCNGQVEVPASGFDIIEVSFSPTDGEDKTLVADIDTATAYYSYVAEPLFELSSGGEVYGGTDGKEKQLGPTGTESAGRFTQGKWYFHVYAYNAAGALIRDGETTVYLAKNATTGLRNTVPITIYRTALRTGNAHFTFTTTSVSADKPYVRVTPVRQGEAKPVRTFYANSVNADGSASFDFTITGLQSGVWEFRLETYDNNVKEGGGAVSTYILGGDTTEVSGSVYPSEWIDMGFAITMPDTIAGTIGSNVSIKAGIASFNWTATSGTAATYKWYLDGEPVQTGTNAFFTHTFSKAGIYSVTCVAVDASGLEMGHSTVTVTVTETAASKASWNFFLPSGGTHTENLPGAITGTPVARVHMEDPNGVIVYSGYPTLNGSGTTWSGSFQYKENGTSYTGTVSISGGKISLTLPTGHAGSITMGVSV